MDRRKTRAVITTQFEGLNVQPTLIKIKTIRYNVQKNHEITRPIVILKPKPQPEPNYWDENESEEAMKQSQYT